MTRTRAAVVAENGAPFVIQNVTLDPLGPGEVLVKNIATGVCHTDMIVQAGLVETPRVLGHEGAGVIVEVGPGVHTLAVGDKVVMSYNSCGSCGQCLSGAPNHCDAFLLVNMAGLRTDGSTSITAEDGSAISGNFFGQSSFAEHSTANVRNVVKLPADTPDELHKILGPLGCGIMTGAGAVINSLKVSAGSSIVVFGAGGVGLSAVLAALASGATKVIVVDINEERLAFAMKLGATHVISGVAVDLVDQVRALTGGGAEFAVETTGNMKVVGTSLECLAVGGTTAMVGLSAPGSVAGFDHFSLGLGRNVIGVVEGDAVPQVFIPKLIELHQAGKFAFDRLITEYAFDDLNAAIHDSHSGDTIKGVVVF